MSLFYESNLFAGESLFEIDPQPPTVVSVSPTTGFIGAYISIQVDSSFGCTSATVCGQPLELFSIVDGTHVGGYLATSTPGIGDVVVTNAYGDSIPLTNAFTVTATPGIYPPLLSFTTLLLALYTGSPWIGRASAGTSLGHDYSYVAPGFNPTALPNLELWFRADQGVTQSGGAVSAWNDFSGTGDSNKHLTQATSGIRPTYTASNANFNNRPTVDFDYSLGTILDSTNFTTPVSLPLTVYFCAKWKPTGTNAFLTDTIDGGGRLAILDNGNDGTDIIPYLFSTDSLIGGKMPSDETFVACIVFNGYDTRLYIGDELNLALEGNAGGITGSQVLTSLRIGGRYTSDSYWFGSLSEFIVYSGAHSTTDRATVMTYLSDRYGLTLTNPYTQLPNCVAHYRMSDGVTQVSNRISEWQDIVGATYTADSSKYLQQADSSQQPYYYASDPEFGGQPSMGTNEIDEALNLVTGTWTTSLAEPSTWYQVYYIPQRASVAWPYYARLSAGGSSSGNHALFGYPRAAIVAQDSAGTTYGPTLLNRAHLTCATYSVTAGNLYTNSTVVPKYVAATNGGDTMTDLFTGTYPAEATQYREAEIIGFSGNHSLATRLRVTKYLRDRYNLKTYPYNQPYTGLWRASWDKAAGVWYSTDSASDSGGASNYGRYLQPSYAFPDSPMARNGHFAAALNTGDMVLSPTDLGAVNNLAPGTYTIDVGGTDLGTWPNGVSGQQFVSNAPGTTPDIVGSSPSFDRANSDALTSPATIANIFGTGDCYLFTMVNLTDVIVVSDGSTPWTDENIITSSTYSSVGLSLRQDSVDSNYYVTFYSYDGAYKKVQASLGASLPVGTFSIQARILAGALQIRVGAGAWVTGDTGFAGIPSGFETDNMALGIGIKGYIYTLASWTSALGDSASNSLYLWSISAVNHYLYSATATFNQLVGTFEGSMSILFKAKEAPAFGSISTAYANPGLMGNAGGTYGGGDGLSFSDAGVTYTTYNGTDWDGVTATAEKNRYNLAQVKWSAGGISLRVNKGSWQTIARTSSILDGSFYVGVNYAATTFFKGEILEVKTSKVALSDTILDQEVTDINTRYNLLLGSSYNFTSWWRSWKNSHLKQYDSNIATNRMQWDDGTGRADLYWNGTFASPAPIKGESLNGHYCLDFAGTSILLSNSPLGFEDLITITDGTVAVLFKARTAAADDTTYGGINNPGLFGMYGGGTYFNITFADAGVRLAWYSDGGGAYVGWYTAVIPCAVNEWHLFQVRWSAGTLSIRLDKGAWTDYTTIGYIGYLSNQAIVGGNYVGSAFFDGQIADIFTDRTALTTTELDAFIDNEINAYYGLAL